MIKTKQGGLIWLVVIVTVVLSMVVVPLSVVADDGIRDPLEDRFRRGGGEEGSGETGFPKTPATAATGSAPDGDSGNIGVKGLVDMLWCEEVSGGVEIDGAAPWKDLDGDGRADVVVVTQEDLGDDQRLFTIIAKNGGTGQHLWEQSLTLEEWLMGWLSVYVRPGADLDGDGCEDVLVHALRYLVDGQLRCTVIAKSGRTGQHLWEESITADESDMFAYPAGDLDGDGRGDVMVETFQYLEEDGEDWKLDWKLIAKRGYDGHHLWEETTTDNTTRSLSSYPVKADLDGDGGADVMVQICRALGMAGYEFTVIAKNGRTGDHLWEQTITRTDDCYWYTPYYTYDLNGDGCPDVLLHIQEGTTDTLVAKNGVTGEHLWERIFSNNVSFYHTRAGDLNGDGRQDFFVGRVITTPGGNIGKATALNGSNGVTLWEQTFGAVSNVSCDRTGDLDGDGKADALVEVYESLGGDINRYTLIAKKGSTGEHLWEESITDEQASFRAWGAGDLDGDGKNDVMVYGWFESSPDMWTDTLIAKKGTNGAHLWQESLTSLYGMHWLDWDNPADFDCDGGLDVLVKFSHFDIVPDSSTGTEKIIAKNGGTGQHLWEIQADGHFEGRLYGVIGFTVTGLGTDIYEPNYRLQRFDLNGDGMNDMVVWTRKKLCAIAPPPCSLSAPSALPPERRVAPLPPHLPPADMRLNNISVNPDNAQAGQPVTVLANVVNNGTSSGSYNVALRINGRVEQQRAVEVSPGSAYPVKFTVTKSQPGTYNVAIEGQKASFTVIGDGASGTSASGGLIALIVMAVLILSTAVVLMMTFRRTVG